MTARVKSVSAPLTFDLPVSLFSKIETLRARRGLGTISDTVRLAVESFGFGQFRDVSDPTRQISVRLSVQQRSTLKRIARKHRASIGEVLRQAILALEKRDAGGKRRRIAGERSQAC